MAVTRSQKIKELNLNNSIGISTTKEIPYLNRSSTNKQRNVKPKAKSNLYSLLDTDGTISDTCLNISSDDFVSCSEINNTKLKPKRISKKKKNANNPLENQANEKIGRKESSTPDLGTNQPHTINELWLIMKTFQESVNFISKQYDEMQTKYSSALNENRQLKTQYNKLNDEFIIYKKNAQQLFSAVNDSEQEKLKNNVVLKNLPKIDDVFQSKQIMVNIAHKLDTQLTMEEISTVQRYPLKSHNKFDYVYQLNNKKKQTDIINKQKKTKLALKSNLEVIQYNPLDGHTQPNTSKIIITQHMTHFNYSLLQKARTLNNFGYKYVWYKYGKVYVRETDDSKLVKITSSDMVDELILKSNFLTLTHTNRITNLHKQH